MQQLVSMVAVAFCDLQCLAVGVLAFSAVTLPHSSLESNDLAGTSSDGVRPELRAAYNATSTVLKYLMAVACLAILTEIAAVAAQIAARCLELKEFQTVSLIFYIPVSQKIIYS